MTKQKARQVKIRKNNRRAKRHGTGKTIEKKIKEQPSCADRGIPMPLMGGDMGIFPILASLMTMKKFRRENNVSQFKVPLL